MQKTNFKTRLLALLTAVFMVIVSMPFAAFAAATDSFDAITVSFVDGNSNKIAEDKEIKSSESLSTPVRTAVTLPDNTSLDGWHYKGDDDGYIGSGVLVSFADLTKAAEADATNKSHGHVTLVAITTTQEPEEPETKTVKFCFQLNTAEGNFTDKNIAGFTSTNVSYVVGGEDTVVNVPAVEANKGYTFKGWTDDKGDFVMNGATYDMFGKNFDAYEDGQTIWMTAVFEKDEEPSQPEEPETKTVKFCFQLKTTEGNFTDKNIAGFTSTNVSYVVGGEDTVVNVPAVKANKGYTFKGWTDDKGDFVMTGATYDMFGKNFDAYEDGQTIWMTAVFEKDGESVQPSKPVAADVNKIYVHFNDEIGLYKTDIVYSDHGYITAPATDMSVSEYDYTWNNDEGLIFNVGDVIKFADVISHAGAFAREDEKTVSAHISFTKTAKKEAPAEAVVRNVIFQLSQVEGAKWATEDEQKAYGKNDRKYQTWSTDSGKYVAPAAAKDGKDFDYWVCNYGDKKIVIRAGEEFNFVTLNAKGIFVTEAGDFTFNPVFKDKASSSSSSASSSSSSSNTTNTSASNTTTTSASQKQVVKPAAAPANTTKVLPKTGATNAAPLIGGSLAVVALLMGYGVYGLVLRKKD